ncbi:nickel pincer cofactor biosynthesis protein LarB [Bacillaceae bacterium]
MDKECKKIILLEKRNLKLILQTLSAKPHFLANFIDMLTERVTVAVMDHQGETLESILQRVQKGLLTVSEAKSLLQAYEDLGFAKLDHQRERRKGFPEVVFGEGKTAEQLLAIFERLMEKHRRVLATRVERAKAEAVQRRFPDVRYDETARTLFWKHPDEPDIVYEGYIAVVSAGTSDLPVAEEAAVTAEAMGCRAERVYDVGVAGIHRLFAHLPLIEKASATVVVAGMEGALPSVVGGLVANPVVAVPTSIGYGANFQGLSALLSMLNSCATGVSVVNIDNGFGAGYYAAMIHRLRYERQSR